MESHKAVALIEDWIPGQIKFYDDGSVSRHHCVGELTVGGLIKLIEDAETLKSEAEAMDESAWDYVDSDTRKFVPRVSSSGGNAVYVYYPPVKFGIRIPVEVELTVEADNLVDSPQKVSLECDNVDGCLLKDIV